MADQNKPVNRVDTDDPNAGRRKFLQVCLGGMGACSAGAVAYPVVAFLGKPINVVGSQKIEIPIDELSEDQARYIDRQGQQIVILYTQKELKVLSASCSHLGCIVTWDGTKHVLHCPCHGALFDDKGQVVSGPVSQPLEEIPFEIVDGKVVIT